MTMQHTILTRQFQPTHKISIPYLPTDISQPASTFHPLSYFFYFSFFCILAEFVLNVYYTSRLSPENDGVFKSIFSPFLSFNLFLSPSYFFFRSCSNIANVLHTADLCISSAESLPLRFFIFWL